MSEDQGQIAALQRQNEKLEAKIVKMRGRLIKADDDVKDAETLVILIDSTFNQLTRDVKKAANEMELLVKSHSDNCQERIKAARDDYAGRNVGDADAD